MNQREREFSTVTSMSATDIARELSVALSFVNQEIRLGKLEALPDGSVSGIAFSRYLATRRVEGQ
jgi:hypothetical protein